MCENSFPISFLWRWRSEDSIVFKFERCGHRGDASIVDGDQGVNCKLCVERPCKEGAPFSWGMELCGCSSCVSGFRSLLNTEGILTLPMSSVEWWISDANVKCFFCSTVQGVAVSVYHCKIFKFCFWVFCQDVVVSEGTDGLISMVWNSLFQGPIGFTCVLNCAVVDWKFPVIDYVGFLSIWNWIFWKHE